MAFFILAEFDWSKIVGPLLAAIITASVAFLLYLLNRKRPSIVECRVIESFSLLRIASSVRERISIQFDGSKINALSQSKIEVVNRGADTLDDVCILFEFPEQTKVLEVTVSPDEYKSQKISDRSYSVSIPFLNSFKPHRERVVVSILCEGSTEELSLSGRGHGWSIKHQSYVRAMGRRLYILSAALPLSLVWAIAYSGIAISLGMPKDEISVRAALVAVPAILPMVITIVISVYTFATLSKILVRAIGIAGNEKAVAPKTQSRRKTKA